MESRTERHGQTEVCTIIHEGREFTALGASVQGRHVAAYLTRPKRSRYVNDYVLTTWGGRTMLACRCEILREYDHDEVWGTTLAVAFRLTHGRAIVGYAYDGGLFRGELVDGIDTDDDLLRATITEAEYWIDRDIEDREREESLCPDCGEEFEYDHNGEPFCPDCLNIDDD